MSFIKCPECKEFHFDHEKCAPAFEYLIPEWGDSWQGVRAYSFEEAAEKACEYDDRNTAEYTIINQGGLEEIQIKNEQGEIKKFKIDAHPVPEYSAREVI